MSRRCTGRCASGAPPKQSMLPRPRSAGTRIPQSQYSQTRLPRPAIMQAPSRPRTAQIVSRQAPISRGTGIPRRGLPLPTGRQQTSRVPCPRRMQIRPPSVTLSTGGGRRNDVNINIRLSIEQDDRELAEFEDLEREMAELEEFERLERQCQIECASPPAQVYDAIPLSTPLAQIGRRPDRRRAHYARQHELNVGGGTMRGLRRQNEQFDAMVAAAAGVPDLAALSPPQFGSPASLDNSAAWSALANQTGPSCVSPPQFGSPPSLDNSAAWNALANQGCPSFMNESMMDNTLDRAMFDDTFDNIEGWNQVVAEADSGYDIGNTSFNYESPGCC